MNATVFLVDTLFSLYLMVVILRLWLQMVQADFYNPLSQFVVKATHPIVGPLRRIIPSIGRFDTATFVLAVAVCALKLITLGLMFGGSLNPVGIAILSVIGVIKETLSLMFWVLLLRAILSWVSQGQSPVDYVLYQLTEPFSANTQSHSTIGRFGLISAYCHHCITVFTASDPRHFPYVTNVSSRHC